MSQWTPQRPEYYVRTGSMFDNPFGVPKDEIVRMILDNPPEVSAQTVFGKYVESSGLVFTAELIEQMIDSTLPRVLGNDYLDRKVLAEARQDFNPRTGEWGTRFASGVDFARQTDFTVISTLDTLPVQLGVGPARLVYWKRLNRVPWASIYAEVGRAMHFFGDKVLCDGTGPGGDVVMDALNSNTYCPVHHRVNAIGSVCMRDGERIPGCRTDQYISLSMCDDYDFNGGRKKELVEHLRNVLSVGYDSRNPDVSFGQIRVPRIVQLVEELSFYTWDDKKLDTDCLFSLALAGWQGLEDVLMADAVGGTMGV